MGEVAPKDEQDDERIDLNMEFERLHIDPHEYRFFGKSSGVMLIQTALELKNEYTGQDTEPKKALICPKRPEYWAIQPVSFLCIAPKILVEFGTFEVGTVCCSRTKL